MGNGSDSIYWLCFCAGLLLGIITELAVKIILKQGGARLVNLRAVLTAAVMGFLTAGLYIRFGMGAPFFLYAVFLVCLASAGMIDLYKQILPNIIVLPGLALALVYHAVRSVLFRDAQIFLSSALGAFTGGVILSAVILLSALILKQDGMGWGDMKFLMMIGAFLGLVNGLLALLLAVLINAAIGAVLLAFRVIKLRTPVPFGPFLAIGSLALLFYDRPILRWLAVYL